MNYRESTNGFPAARLGRGMAALVHDATCIAELQARLVALDLQDGSKRIRNGVILAVLGGALLLACLPVGMIGIAELFVAALNWQRWIAYLTAGGLGLFASLVLLWLCWRAVRKSAAALQRSGTEFSRNLEWFKESLRPERGESGY